jgi:aspartyl-tRNA(Asn)/glutamyl-tRNA(Gln) amidotransferase subunit B
MRPPPDITSTSLRVGLEVHIELATRSKMFSRSANVAHPDRFDAPPNSLTDAIVLALPGALPVINRKAVELAALVGLALRCSVAPRSRWDRKHYFYPDLPKGYQISQYDLPLCFDGSFDLALEDGSSKRIGIIRAHLEEDAGKLGHELPGGLPYDGSLVDFNRAGTPLLEIVTAPDFASASEVVAFARELRSICRYLGATEGVMQRGHMRFEPNINVVIRTADGREFATPIVEVKNLNSFKSLEGAIEHEAKRQVDEWREDGLTHGPGMKSTRGWDDVRSATFLQRSKEDAHDYRYFPDPDLPPVEIDDRWLARLRGAMIELPAARRARYMREHGLAARDAAALTEERALSDYFDACVAAAVAAVSGADAPPPDSIARATAKTLLNAGAKRANERGVGIESLGPTPAQIGELVALRERGEIGSNNADSLFDLLCGSRDGARDLAARRGLLQVRDDSALDRWVDEAIAAHQQAAADVRAGKDAATGRLVGHVMKASAGRADAAAIRERIMRRLRG